MTQLTFFFSTPGDLLVKLRRDYSRLCNVASAGDQEKIADCLFDFASTGYSLIDWLKEYASASFSKAAVEDYVKKNPPLDACRDICNANKHCVITKYTPVTNNVYASATGTTSIALSVPGSGVPLESDPNQPFRVKVLLSDGTKYEVCEFGKKVIDAWDAFISTNNVQ